MIGREHFAARIKTVTGTCSGETFSVGASRLFPGRMIRSRRAYAALRARSRFLSREISCNVWTQFGREDRRRMNYVVKAINGRSEVVSLELRAPDIPSARQIARHQGLRVLSLKPSYKRLLGPSLARARFSPTLLSIELLSLL